MKFVQQRNERIKFKRREKNGKFTNCSAKTTEKDTKILLNSKYECFFYPYLPRLNANKMTR